MGKLHNITVIVVTYIILDSRKGLGCLIVRSKVLSMKFLLEPIEICIGV